MFFGSFVSTLYLNRIKAGRVKEYEQQHGKMCCVMCPALLILLSSSQRHWLKALRSLSGLFDKYSIYTESTIIIGKKTLIHDLR